VAYSTSPKLHPKLAIFSLKFAGSESLRWKFLLVDDFRSHAKIIAEVTVCGSMMVWSKPLTGGGIRKFWRWRGFD